MFGFIQSDDKPATELIYSAKCLERSSSNIIFPQTSDRLDMFLHPEQMPPGRC